MNKMKKILITFAERYSKVRVSKMIRAPHHYLKVSTHEQDHQLDLRCVNIHLAHALLQAHWSQTIACMQTALLMMKMT